MSEESKFVPVPEVNPDGRVQIKLELSPKAKQEHLAALVRRGNGPTVDTLPRFVDGLLLVGNYDLIDTKYVQRIDAKGNTEVVMDPIDSILTGRITGKDTMDFLMDRVASVHVWEMYATDIPQRGQKEEIVRYWNKFRQESEQLKTQRNNERNILLDTYEQLAFNNGGVTNLRGFKNGETREWSAFQLHINSFDRLNAEELRQHLRVVRGQFTGIPQNLPWEAPTNY